MRVEGVDHGIAAELAGSLDHRFDDRAVPHVKTIEIPHRDDGVIQERLELTASANVLQC
jgi:hypothetical protein